MLEVLLCHAEHISAVCQEHIASVAVLCHVLVLAFLEVLQFCFVARFARNPARLVQMHRLPAALCSVFVLQAVLYHLELQLAHCAYYLASIELVHEQLCHTLVHQLVYALFQLLCLHGVGILDIFEHLGREGRKAAEVQLLALGQGVSYLEYTVVGQTYDITSPSLVDSLLALCHELRGAGETYCLAVAYVQVWSIAHELSRAHLAEGYT